MALEGANIFTAVAKQAVNQRGNFSVALSGGSTPRLMHRMLAEEPYIFENPWDKTHLFWVDERCVPKNNPASNYGNAKRDFLDRVPIPDSQVHPMSCDQTPEQGAKKYQSEIMNFFRPKAEGFPVFDLILLGIGSDGHIASLFPGQPAVQEKKEIVLAVKGGNPDVNRITMTLPIIGHARHTVILASGEEKAAVIRSVFEEDYVPRMPAKKLVRSLGM